MPNSIATPPSLRAPSLGATPNTQEILRGVRSTSLILDIKINGVSIPIYKNPRPQIYIFETVKQTLPSCQFQLDDPSGVINKALPASDGCRIEITVGVDGNTRDYAFKGYGKPAKIPSLLYPGASAYVFQGISPYAELLAAAPPQVVEGTSRDVFSSIAKALGLNFKSNFQAADKMAWLPSNQDMRSFMSHVSQHAFEDMSSVAAHAVGADGTLHFHNVTKLMATERPKAYFYFGQDLSQGQSNGPGASAPSSQTALLKGIPRYPAADFMNISRGGDANLRANYGMRTTQINTDGAVKIHDYVQATQTARIMDLDKENYRQVNASPRVHLAPIVSDLNVHESFIQARHQNQKLGARFNQNIYVLNAAGPSATKLFDMIAFSKTGADGAPDPDVCGTYILTGKTVFAAQGMYYEKLELTSAGMNNFSDQVFGRADAATTTRPQGDNSQNAIAGVLGNVENMFQDPVGWVEGKIHDWF